MVSIGVSWNGKKFIFFSLIYRKQKLTRTVTLICWRLSFCLNAVDVMRAMTLNSCKSVLSHRTKMTQQFLRQNTPDFIDADELASYSPDLNPSDYCIWDILQDLVYEGRRLPFANLQDLKEAVKNEWKEVIIETERKSIAQWKKWLIVVRKQNGGAIQHIFR